MSSTSSVPFQPRIAIIGGGLGGLSLLLTLSRRGVPATLYEREEGFNARAHLGGSLDLGWKSGQRALRENGLQEEFNKNSRPEGEEMRLYDASGKLHFSMGLDEEDHHPQGNEEIRPEIDRTVLRKILLDACSPDSIKWGHALTSVRAVETGVHELTFANGTTTVVDILVGADGAHSRIRPLLSPATPEYTGVNGVEISLAPEVVARPDMQDVVTNVGQGTMFATQDNKMLGSQPNMSGRIRTYVFHRASADWSVPTKDPAATREILLDLFAGWAPWMRKLIEHCDDEAIYLRPMYILPVGHSWAHVPGVTILGDAAHLQSPFAGAGANLAMLDGLELGLAVADVVGKSGTREDLEKAVEKSEKAMCEMAARVSRISLDNLHAWVNSNAPQSVLDRFQVIMTLGEREG